MILNFLRQVGHVIVLMILIWWGYQLMAMHVDFGQRLADPTALSDSCMAGC
jgi:hypothetical protein